MKIIKITLVSALLSLVLTQPVMAVTNGEWTGTSSQGFPVTLKIIDNKIEEFSFTQDVCGIEWTVERSNITISNNSFVYFGSYYLNNQLIYTFRYTGNFMNAN